MKIWNSVINQNLNEIRVTKLCLHCTKKIIGRIVYWLFDRFDLKIMKIFRSQLGASTSFQFCCFTNNRFIVTSVDLGTVHYRTSRNSATAKNRSLFLLLEFFHNSILVFSISAILDTSVKFNSKNVVVLITVFANYSKCRILILAFSTNFCLKQN